ncbi:hypothetical protein ACQZN4_001987 [Vibrio alginolyticus]
MTQNIEERTLAATATMEGAAKAVDEIANTDKVVETPVGQRKSIPMLSRELDEENVRRESKFIGAQNYKDQEFQDRFSVSQSALVWQPLSTVSDKLQRYYVGSVGTESYKEYLPNPVKLPFETGEAIEDDIANSLWLENGVPNTDLVNRKAELAISASLNKGEPTLVIDYEIDAVGKAITNETAIKIQSKNKVYKFSSLPLPGVIDEISTSTPSYMIVSGVKYYLFDVSYSIDGWASVISFGINGDGVFDESEAIEAALNYAANNGLSVTFFGIKKCAISRNIGASFSGNTQIDFSGCEFIALNDIQSSPVLEFFNHGVLHVKGGVLDAKSMAYRGVSIKGMNDNTVAVVSDFSFKSFYGKGAGTLGVWPVCIHGNGASATVRDVVIDGVDCDIDRQNTQGMLVGRLAAGDGYDNVLVENIKLKNITEGGGASNEDSDAIKVFGYLNEEKFCNAIIRNISFINDPGKSIKRIVKTQVSSYLVYNINGIMSDFSDGYIPIDNQRGCGYVKNVYLNLKNINFTAAFGNPQYVSQKHYTQSSSVVENITIYGYGCTFDAFALDFAEEADSRIDRNYSSITGVGFTYSCFNRINSDNDHSSASYEDIDLSQCTNSTGVWSESTDRNLPLEINYVFGTFKNVVLDSWVNAVGPYSGSVSAYTFYKVVDCKNSMIFFGGGSSLSLPAITKYPKSENNVYSWAGSCVSDKSGGVGSVDLLLEMPGLNWDSKYMYQLFMFEFKANKSISGNLNSSASSFTVGWLDANTPTVFDLIETNEGVAQLKGPTASFDYESKTLSISFTTDTTSQNKVMLNIRSSLPFTLKKVFNVNI